MHMIGDRIKQRRQELNMSRAELAERIGKKDRSIIFRYEKGDVDIPISVLQSLSEALDVSIIYLLGLEDEYVPRPTESQILNDPIVLDAIEKAKQEVQDRDWDLIAKLICDAKFYSVVKQVAALTPLTVRVLR